MTKEAQQRIVTALLNSLDIPPSAYEKASKRYHDLGQWFERPESKCSGFSPRIYPQGSFRLGTVTRPMDENGSFDLDVGCRLETGITKTTCTQAQLKELVRHDLEAYRNARRIEQELEEKRRCWTLEYADELSFHMDVVPSIPEDDVRRRDIREAMIKQGAEATLAQDVSEYTGAITDKDHPQFRTIAADWRISNSEGYAKWFESRIKLCRPKATELAEMAKQAQVDALPAWEWKSPLQEAVQILKCHRDVMYKSHADSKPISIIITTLAAYAYQGEATTAEALERILADMGQYLRITIPRVPNPVNPAEDFADKWHDPKYAHLDLEANFQSWLTQARADIAHLKTLGDSQGVQKFAARKFGTTIKQRDLDDIEELLSVVPAKPAAPYVITHKPPSPWCA